jgi:hypothetical protein
MCAHPLYVASEASETVQPRAAESVRSQVGQIGGLSANALVGSSMAMAAMSSGAQARGSIRRIDRPFMDILIVSMTACG